MSIFGVALIVVLGIVVVLLISIYNKLVQLRMRVDNAWSQIDVQLKRRYDLIPNVVETVKGYAKHERELFERVTEARANAINAAGVESRSSAENQLTQALRTVFAVAENYPELKANENFKALQEELSNTESKIAFSRQFYNDTVMKYNQTIQMFPSNIVASLFGFSAKNFFEIDVAERSNVTVNFGEENKK
jgi:LemA protein